MNDMGRTTLVVMAAGLGSRFGGGIKQLEPVGPNGEIIMDYSIYDALEAGFNKVVFVIRKNLEDEFKRVIGNRIEQKVEVSYAFQEIDEIPEKFREKYHTRKKPWGTGQAVLCCKDVINEPFLVINADDYYGKEAYRNAYRFLNEVHATTSKEQACMIGFRIGNTLSENGGVTRGICITDENQYLKSVVETKNIIKTPEGAGVLTEEKIIPVEVESLVSMNMWGLQPSFFPILEDEFLKFLEEHKSDFETAEYLLPTIMGSLLEKEKVEIKVLESHDTWFGVTYKEDKEKVVNEIGKLIAAGLY